MNNDAGKMEFKDGAGDITAMCSCGEFLEVYKVDKTFRIRSPNAGSEQIHGENTPWTASAIANVGSRNLIVARVFLQGEQLLRGGPFPESLNREEVVLSLHKCKESLLACEVVAERLVRGITKITDEIKKNGLTLENARTINPFPQVDELEFDCTSFLINANRAIRLICEVPKRILNLSRFDANFDYLSQRLQNEVGEESLLLDVLRSNAVAVKRIIDLRNFHEHPREIETIITNFHLLGRDIKLPEWHLTGESPSPINEELPAIVAFLRDAAELVLARSLELAVSNSPFMLARIPDAETDARKPVRLQWTIDPTRMAKNESQ